MPKVHSTSAPAAPTLHRRPTHFNRLSLVYSVVFTVKLATTPFMAYLTEPLPWAVPAAIYPASGASTSVEFSALTAAYLQSIYNNRTLSPATVCRRDVGTSSFMMRQLRPLPSSTPECTRYLINLPGAALYSPNMRQFVCNFVGESTSGRATVPWHHCDHVVMAGLPMGDFCLWFESTPDPTDFMVYHTLLIRETLVMSWCKLAFRLLLSMYIVRVVWRRYYRHYRVLLENLESLGVGSFCAFQVVVGDPTYMVLSDSFVSTAMMVDVWLGLPYLAIATVRAGQIADTRSFVLGCMYSARYVWAGYVMMWIVSKLVQRRGWERSFSPVDPAHLAMLAYAYGGPMVLLMSNSILMVPIQALTDVSAIGREGVFDALPGCVFWTAIMAAVPVVVSTGWGVWRRVRALCLAAPDQCRLRTRCICPRMHNDLKSRCVLVLALRRVPRTVAVDGGKLYALLDHHPHLRRMPLFSHRGADCNVLAYGADKAVARQFRLTFRDCLALDRRRAGADPIIECAGASPSSAFCTLSTSKCPSCPPDICTAEQLRLHRGANDCRWVLYPDDDVKGAKGGISPSSK